MANSPSMDMPNVAESRKALQAFAVDKASGEMRGRLVVNKSKDGLEYRKLTFIDKFIPKCFSGQAKQMTKVAEFCQEKKLFVSELTHSVEELASKSINLTDSASSREAELKKAADALFKHHFSKDTFGQALMQLASLHLSPEELKGLFKDPRFTQDMKLLFLCDALDTGDDTRAKSIVAALTPHELDMIIERSGNIDIKKTDPAKGYELSISTVRVFEKNDSLIDVLRKAGRSDLIDEKIDTLLKSSPANILPEAAVYLERYYSPALAAKVLKLLASTRRTEKQLEGVEKIILVHLIQAAVIHKDKKLLGLIDRKWGLENLATIEDRYGHNLLAWAAYNNSKDFLFGLLDKMEPKSIFTPDSRGRTVLHYAAYKGHEDIVKKLIFLSDDPPAQLGMLDKKNVSALEFAQRFGYRDIFKSLAKALTS